MVALVVFQASAFFLLGLLKIPLLVAALAMVPAAGLSVYGAWLGHLRHLDGEASILGILLRAACSGAAGMLVSAGGYVLGLASG